MWEKIKAWGKGLYRKLACIDEPPHRVALGFALGVFVGIFPGTGPLFALGVAFLFRLPKAPTLLGGVLTNSWSSLLAWIAAAQIGSFVCGVDLTRVQESAKAFLKDFTFGRLFSADLWEALRPVLFPLGIGFAVVGAISGLCAYFIVLYILRKRG